MYRIVVVLLIFLVSHCYDGLSQSIMNVIPQPSNAWIKNGWGITVDSQGFIYVADVDHHWIFKYFPDGSLSGGIRPGGVAGTGAPSGGVIDTDGTGYIVERDFGMVRAYNSSTGLFIRDITSFSGDRKVTMPVAIAFTKDGRLAIVDKGSNKVLLITKNGEYVTHVGPTGSGSKSLNNPHGITVDADGNIFVADAGNFRIVKYRIQNNSFVFVSEFGSNGNLPGQFAVNDVMNLTMGWDGHLFVGDKYNNRIQEFTTDGQFVKMFSCNHPNAIVGTSDDQILAISAEGTPNTLVRYSKFAIHSFQPTSAQPGTIVTINGIGFSPTAGSNNFRVDGKAVVIDTSIPPTRTQLRIKLPDNATTGKITAISNNFETQSPKEFVVDLKVTDFSPKFIGQGQTITITGTGFSSNATSNKVKIGNIDAVVVEASPTQLKVTAPDANITDKITVQVEDIITATSANIVVSKLAVIGVTYPTSSSSELQTVPMLVHVNNLANLKSMTINYRGVTSSDTAYQKQSLIIPSTTNTSVAFDIPISVFADPVGTQIYCSATDQENMEFTGATAYVFKVIRGTSDQAVIPNLSFGKKPSNYQLISIPTILQQGSVQTVFKDLGGYERKNWRLFGIKSGTIQELDQAQDVITHGSGYWLIVRDKTTIRHGEGRTPIATADNPVELTLLPGWNIVGNPYLFTISWEDVLDANPNINTVGTLRFFSGGSYIQADLLKPYQAAFVQNTSNAEVKIKIPVVNKNPGGGRMYKEEASAIDAPAWTVNLTATDGEISNSLLAIGMHELASLGKDRFDETALPSPEGLNTFVMSLRKNSLIPINRDIVPTSSNYTWTGNLSSENDIALSWDHQSFGNNDRQLVLDMDGIASIVDMRTSSYTTLPAGTGTFKIHFGDRAYIDKVTISDNAIVGYPFPNPKSKLADITIPVSIPDGGATVQARIVDLNGKTTYLGATHFEAGRHQLTLDQSTFDSSSGLNLIQIEIHGRTAWETVTRKIVLH